MGTTEEMSVTAVMRRPGTGTSSILPSNRRNGLRVEIEGSCWPRILVLSEESSSSVEQKGRRRRKNGKIATTGRGGGPVVKTSRGLKKRKLIHQLMKASPKKKVLTQPQALLSSCGNSTPPHSSHSPSSPIAVTTMKSDAARYPSSVDQNKRPTSIVAFSDSSSWSGEPTTTRQCNCFPSLMTTKISPYTGRVVEDYFDGKNKHAAPAASGIQRPLFRR